MRLIRVCARDARSINVTRRCTKIVIRECVTMRGALFLFRGTKNIFAPSRARRQHQPRLMPAKTSPTENTRVYQRNDSQNALVYCFLAPRAILSLSLFNIFRY